MKKIGIIINPYARKNRKMKRKLNIYKEIGGDYVDVHITESFKDVDKAIKDFKMQDVTYIGISGGDGTIHQVLTRLIHEYGSAPIPPIVILKGGTMDNVSKSINLNGNGPAILKRLIDSVHNDNEITICERDSMKIGDRYCFLFGIGLITNFLNEVYNGKREGFVQNTRVALMAITQSIKEPQEGSLFTRITAQIYADNRLIKFNEVIAILAGTVEHIAKGFKPLSRANEKDRMFQAMITCLTPFYLVRNLLKIRKGKKVNHHLHYDDIVSNLKIRSKKSFQYTMDGDLYDSDGELEVGTGLRIKLVHV